MEIESLGKEDRTLKLVVEDSTPAFMNALRRISMNDVPVLAIEDVFIDKNNSALFDEIIAQRLGQIPLKFDPEKFNFREECDCEEGCPNCQVRFSLEKEGPGMVYSGDIVSENEEVVPLYDNIPITQLDENQRVKLEATAELSTGQDHSKHQAAISSYQYYPIINISESELTKKDVERCVEVCPRDVYGNQDGKLKVVDEKSCTLCKECEETVGKEKVQVEGNDTKFIFKIESISALEPEEILEISLDRLSEKADRVIEKFET